MIAKRAIVARVIVKKEEEEAPTRGGQRTGTSVDVGEARRHEIPMMVSADGLRVRVMRPGSVMMADARLGIAVMMMRVLSLMLLVAAHQAVTRDVQIRGTAAKVVGVLVKHAVGMHVRVKVPVHAAFHRRGLVMMLIRVQRLLHALQLVLAAALLLRRQAGVSVVQLFLQVLAGRVEHVRTSLHQQWAGTGGQAVLIILQI